MTLTSYVAIGGDATDIRRVYQLCAPIVRTPDGTSPFVHDSWRPGRKRLSNPAGLGALACLDIEYSPDGPLGHVCSSRCLVGHVVCERGDPDDEPDENGWSSALVILDTAYGYRGAGGDGCADVHAHIISEIGRGLDAWGRPWKWFDFDHCTWHDGSEGVSALGDPHLTVPA